MASTSDIAQSEYWNGRAGQSWTELQDRMDESLREITQALMAAAAPRAGERVLDVGCGCGETSLLAADAVGATGRVTGLDVSEPMLGRARERGAGRTNLAWRLADASKDDLGGPYDLLLSRFGVMFFADPVAAFRHLAGALGPGARVVFVCWQDMRKSAWLATPMRTVRPLLTAAESFPPEDPDAPGPNAFARRERVESILAQAGFTDVTLEPREASVSLGRSVDDALYQMMRIGPVARAIAEEPEHVRAKVKDALRGTLEEIASRGPLALGASYWLVRARV